MKKVSGNQSVEAQLDDAGPYNKGTWLFCQNGYQRSGIDISVEQFDIMKELVNTPDVVEFYEKLRGG